MYSQIPSTLIRVYSIFPMPFELLYYYYNILNSLLFISTIIFRTNFLHFHNIMSQHSFYAWFQSHVRRRTPSTRSFHVNVNYSTLLIKLLEDDVSPVFLDGGPYSRINYLFYQLNHFWISIINLSVLWFFELIKNNLLFGTILIWGIMIHNALKYLRF